MTLSNIENVYSGLRKRGDIKPGPNMPPSLDHIKL